MSVHTKLMQARMALHKQPIKKSGRNTFANYSYMELADFLIPTQTIFAELGLCGIVSFTADIASLTITDTEDGTSLLITSPMGSAALKGCHEVQNIGAVETYQRRYLWVTAMEIVEHDALDSAPPADLVPVLERSIEQAKQKKAGVMAAVLADLDLSAEVVAALGRLAEKVKAEKDTAQAFDLIEVQGLDQDEKTWLWSLLPSNVRSALKREGQTRSLTKETA